jgi:hypothetical protein
VEPIAGHGGVPPLHVEHGVVEAHVDAGERPAAAGAARGLGGGVRVLRQELAARSRQVGVVGDRWDGHGAGAAAEEVAQPV